MRRALEWLGGSVLVYVLLAACAGANGGGHQAAAGGAPDSEEVAAGGVPATLGAGGKDDAMGGALGGMLDPVPAAMAAGTAGAAPSEPTPVSFKRVDVHCSATIRFGGSDIPTALLDIDPPSVPAALSVMHTVPAQNGEGAWLQGSTGGYVKADGSQLGVTCSKATDVVSFYVAN